MFTVLSLDTLKCAGILHADTSFQKYYWLFSTRARTHTHTQVLFVHIDMSEDSALRVADFFNIEESDVPTCRLINLESDMKKFVPDFEGIDLEKLGPWVQEYLDGNLKVNDFLC